MYGGKFASVGDISTVRRMLNDGCAVSLLYYNMAVVLLVRPVEASECPLQDCMMRRVMVAIIDESNGQKILFGGGRIRAMDEAQRHATRGEVIDVLDKCDRTTLSNKVVDWIQLFLFQRVLMFSSDLPQPSVACCVELMSRFRSFRLWAISRNVEEH